MKGQLFVQRKQNGTLIQKPKSHEVDLYIDLTGDANVFKGRDLFSKLVNARVDFISANGINIVGVEDPTGTRTKMFYQEWWFIPRENDEKR